MNETPNKQQDRLDKSTENLPSGHGYPEINPKLAATLKWLIPVFVLLVFFLQTFSGYY